MKRFLLIVIILGLFLWAGVYIFYRVYLPDLVAKALVADETPSYIPRRIMNKVDELRAPVNKGADEMIIEMKKNEIPLDDVVEVIESTTEDEAYEFLKDLNESQPKTPDEVFDIAKKHVEADFDIEVFRKPFVENVSMASIKKAMRYANTNQRTKDLDIVTGRAIAKQILIEKYNQVSQK
ncbi:MAG TPA: hypothetical protein VGD65_24540 [Chryseosolibacter sp.]